MIVFSSKWIIQITVLDIMPEAILPPNRKLLYIKRLRTEISFLLDIHRKLIYTGLGVTFDQAGVSGG